MGEVIAIWLKRFKGGPMDLVQEAEAIAGHGLVGNANQGGPRQVTLIDEARWREAQEEVGVAVDPSARRANVMLRGIDLENTFDRLLNVGGCTIRIVNLTRPCEQMEAAQAGLREALGRRWRGGAFGEVVEGGTLRAGDPASWAEPETVAEGVTDGEVRNISPHLPG